jgi:putative adenylate-forming enzyme
MIDSLFILQHYLLAKRPQPWHSRAELEEWQKTKFERFAQRVLRRSPYYKPFVDARCPFSEYPTSDKAKMNEHFDLINTRQLSRQKMFDLAHQAETSRNFKPMLGDLSVGLSSGTSGSRGLFVASKKERLQYAGVILSKSLPESILKEQRIALLLRANNQLYEAVGGGKISFRYFDLFSPWHEVLERLMQFQPTVLVGPPQTLSLLARAQQIGQIIVSPQKIIAGAEVLDDLEAATIKSAFDLPVHQIYQATEGFLGITCSYGTMHLNEDYVIFERQWIDRQSRRFLPLITDFTRSTQPIVRYRLNDILIEKEGPCPCRSLLTAIERIEGRTDDILFLPRLNDLVLMPVMPDFVRDVIAPRYDVVGDYCVAQVSPDAIEFSVSGADNATAKKAVADALQSLCDRMRLRCPTLILKDGIGSDPKLKLRRVKRLFPVPEGSAWTAF